MDQYDSSMTYYWSYHPKLKSMFRKKKENTLKEKRDQRLQRIENLMIDLMNSSKISMKEKDVFYETIKKSGSLL